jgi:ABC-type sugar transport system permease subunit
VSTRVDVKGGVRLPSKPSPPTFWRRAGARTHPRDATGLWIFLFLLPFLFLYGAFTLWPLVATFAYSFFEWGGIGPLTGKDFIGLGNYAEMVHDPLFWSSFKNTLIFAFANTLIKLPLSLVVATVLTRRWLWLKRLFRTVIFVPLILPVSIAGLIFTYLLNPANGALDSFLLQIHAIKEPIDILGHGNSALAAIILVSVWQIFGQYVIYWMAALQAVPEDLYEAAELDRANEWQKLIHITLPSIRPTAVVIALLALVNALDVLNIVVTLTGGGPGTSTYVTPFYVFEEAFQYLPFRYGYASAIAMFYALFAVVFVVAQHLLNRPSDQAVESVGWGGRA